MSFTVNPLFVIFQELDRYRLRFGDGVELTMRVNGEVARRILAARGFTEEVRDGFEFQLGGASIVVADSVHDIEVSALYKLSSVMAAGSYVT